MANATFTVPPPRNEPVKTFKPGSSERTAVKEMLQELKQRTIDLPIIIDGERIVDRPTQKVLCPHDHHRVLGNLCSATADDLDRAIKVSVEAQKSWAELPWEERAAVFLRAADLVSGKYRALINAATMLGQSKTVHQAEIDAACELIDFFRFNAHFAEQIYRLQPNSLPGTWNRSEARGLEGFVFAVTPFNFTSICVNLPTAPVLMGCSALWKPAPTSAYACHFAYQILEEAGLPPGVINMVNGNHAVIGQACLESEHLAGVHFTGSTATFNYLWREVGQRIDKYKSYPRLVGETGGKDFVFAHSSADVETLVTALVRGAFEYQGQKCSAASRAYIPESLWPEVKERLVEQTNGIQMGDPEDFRNFMAAVIDKRAFDKIVSFIEHAKSDDGAAVVCGGEYDDSKGYFIRPTVIQAHDPQYKTMVEEIFGPVLTVYVYQDNELDKTLELCDRSTAYSLTGAIFARDRRVVHYMTKKLANAAGNFYINDKPTGAVVGEQPFGGGRKSGTNDKAGSMLNLLRWVSMRTIKENFVPITEYGYPFMRSE